jgi:uncharacterized membrane protein
VKRHDIGGRSEALARGLGWFSIGLGIAEIVAPNRLSRLIGVDEHPVLMRLLGVRETLSGIGILARKQPTACLWSRVAGDGMDLALLGAAIASGSGNRTKVLGTIAAVGGVTALDTLCSIRFTQAGRVRVAKSVITVNRPLTEVYEFWRDEENLDRFFKSVPTDLEIVTARPNEFIEIRSIDGVAVRSGSVTFTPAFGRDGTEVHATVHGMIPQRLLHEDLRRSKRLLETGEIPTTEGQSAGPRASAAIARMIHRLEGKEVA